MDCYLPARSLLPAISLGKHLGQGRLAASYISSYCYMHLITFLLFLRFYFLREEAEELGINLVDDISKLLGIMLEVEVIHLYYQHPTLYLFMMKSS